MMFSPTAEMGEGAVRPQDAARSAAVVITTAMNMPDTVRVRMVSSETPVLLRVASITP